MTQHILKSSFETVLLPPKGQFFDRSGTRSVARTFEADPALLPIIGVHPAVIKIAMSAVVWFLAVAWFDFSGGPEVDLSLAVVTGFFVMFFTLFLLAASMVIDDPRWKQPRGTMRGRDVLIHILLLPVCLAAAATLIGLVRHLQS